MFTTLVESRGARERRAGGTVLSVALHTTMISLAIYATATASPRERSDSREILHYVPQAPRTHVTPAPAERLAVGAVPRVVVPGLDVLSNVPSVIPHVDLTAPAADMGFWKRRAAGLADAADGSPGGRPSAAPYLAVQVDKPAAPAPGSAAPSYPAMLREAGVTGRVVVEFVVDTVGRVEPHSFRVLQSDNPSFDDAIRAALPRMRFYPAEAGGHRVRQLVEQPFTFTLTGGGA